MTATFSELLGEHLLRHDESGNESSQVPTNQLNGKTVALYFSAHWCPPCRKFTPQLAKVFKEINNEVKDKLDIVFVSSDEDSAAFDEYFNTMPWKALPYSDRDRSKTLGEKFNVEGIPCLVVLSSSLEIISSTGVEEVQSASKDALRKWSEGKGLFWSREAREGEHTWDGTTCTGCFMNPLIGSRHGCADQNCQLDLCETCLSKSKHEHPLIEYLIPKQKYTLQQLFASVPHLLDPKKDEKIETKTMWENDVKSIGFYFSAHWCPPCRSFTPILADLYKEVQSSSPSFRIVFVSCDHDDESFNEYRAEMPWPAVPLESGTLLKAYFHFSGIPSLIVVSSDGKVLSRQGRDNIAHKGVEALQTWAQGKSLPRPPADEFEWAHVSCDGCAMSPLIGQRYSCATCGNYDLCSACQKKGHEHPLELEPQSAADEND